MGTINVNIGNSSKNNKKRRISSKGREFNPYFREIEEGLRDEEELYDSEVEDLEAESRLREAEQEIREDETAEERYKRLKAAKLNEQYRKREEGRSRIKGTFSLSAGRVFSLFIIAIIWCVVLVRIDYTLYMKWIKYPPEMIVDESKTGWYCLQSWLEVLSGRDNGFISSYIGDLSYLEEENKYANGNEERIKFFDKMLSTVSYEPKTVNSINIYGNPLVDSEGEIVKRNSYVSLGEEVNLSYVDYASVAIDEEKVKSILQEKGTSLGTAGYVEDLTDAFCEYMLSYESLPIKSENYVPNLLLDEEGYYYITDEEDIYLDKLLFSSDDFYDLLERFSLAAGKGAINPEWLIWSSSKELYADNFKDEEPIKILDSISATKDWLEWSSSKEKKKEEEPPKYSQDYVIGDTWCGAYHLLNEYFEYNANGDKVYRKVLAPLGDGSFENPASLGTGVITTAKWTGASSSGLEVTLDMPISVKMVEYGVSQEALDWFDSKDKRNRGHDINSELQYVYYVFEVKNLSDRELTVTDNSSLSDSGKNLYPRTGSIYGLKSQVDLKPGESGYIESWASSKSLNRLYIIWGADFSRTQDVVWFRKLKGDIEDTSWNKGVSLNTSRLGEDVVKEQDGYAVETEITNDDIDALFNDYFEN